MLVQNKAELGIKRVKQVKIFSDDSEREHSRKNLLFTLEDVSQPDVGGEDDGEADAMFHPPL